MNNEHFYQLKSNGSNSGFEASWQPEDQEFGRSRVRPSRPQSFRPRLPAPRKPLRRPTPRRPRFPRPINYGNTVFIEPQSGTQGSEYMRWVQTMLNQVLNLQLPIDGISNVQTRSAIRSFQEKNSLPVTGMVGPDTERALMAAGSGQTQAASPAGQDEPAATPQEPGTTDSAEPPSSAGEFEFEWETEVNRNSGEYIKWLQQSLNQIMGLRLAVDGIAGPQTRSAIRSFQQRAGLLVDGIVGSRTEAALRAAGASLPPSGSSAPSGTITQPDIVQVRGILVARQIAPQVEALLSAAQADGVQLSGWGYRSTERQIELRKKNCGPTQYDIWQKPSSECTPPTATPGRSMHEKGLAIDFTYNGSGISSHDNPGYQWLAQNAERRFGLKNLPSEPWHWSVNGK